MKRYATWSVLILIVALVAPSVGADVKTRSKTTIKFEGMMGRIMSMAIDNDVEQTVAVRGSRMSTRDGDTGQIIDLAEEKIYAVDYDDKAYTVKTFAEMRAELEELKKQMAESVAAQQPPTEDPAQEAPPAVELEFDVSVDETGETKRIANLDTRQVIMTLTARQKGRTLEDGGGFVMTNDMWLAPAQPEAQEIVDFTMKYAQAVYGEALGIDPRQAASMSALFPALGDLSSKMIEEAKKMQGTPIRTESTFETVKSAEQMQSQPQPSGGGGGLGGMLARRLGGNRNASPRSTVMTTTHELESITTTVTDADVSIPEGFRERQ